MGWIRGRPGETAVWLATAATVVLATCWLVVAPTQAVGITWWLGRTLTLVFGLLIVVAGLPRASGERRLQTLVALASVIWATAASVESLGHAVDLPPLALVAEWSRLVALVPLAAAARHLPRHHRALRRVGMRVGLDGMTVGLALAMTVIALALPGPLGSVPGVSVADLVVAFPLALTVAAAALLGLLTRPPRHVTLTLLGLLLLSLAEGVGTFASQGLLPTAVVGVAGLLAIVGGGTASVGMLGLGDPRDQLPAVGHGGDLRGERRDLVVQAITSGTSYVLVAAGFANDVVRGERISLYLMAMSLVAVVLLAAREVIATVTRRRMVATVMTASRMDPLTGLANRLGIADRVDADLSEKGTLVILDLDSFSHVNEVLGHSGANGLLVGVARALQAVPLPKGSVLARTGGDEFAAWVPGDADPLAVAQRLARAATDARYGAGGGGLAVTVAAGATDTSEIGDEAAVTPAMSRADTLLQRAAAALVLAKSHGPASVASYDADLAAQHRRRQLIERRLDEMLQSPASGEGVVVHLQPVVDLITGRVVSAEALARWHDPELGNVTPAEFIPIAEHTGLIVALGHRVLALAVDALVQLQATRPDLTVAVNVSAAQLRARPGSTSFTDDVRRCLAERGIDPDRLVVEVTESILISEDDPAIGQLRRLIDLGVRVSVDDFGSGYWALGYLQWLPAHILKIDRSLVVKLGGDRRSDAVVGAIAGLATDLGMSVVVEGVETREIATRASELGAGLAQGWHFAKAVPVGDLVAVAAEIGARDPIGGRGERRRGIPPPRSAADRRLEARATSIGQA